MHAAPFVGCEARAVDDALADAQTRAPISPLLSRYPARPLSYSAQRGPKRRQNLPCRPLLWHILARAQFASTI